jgi:GT2 family glycosyltransferase
LTISVISADNLDLLLPCLDSIFTQTHRAALETYLVDNASTDSTSAYVETRYPQLSVIRNDRRLGFSTNNNLVFKRGRGRYKMLLNDDTVILAGALDRLVAFMDDHPTVGVVGAQLVNTDHSAQPSFSRFPHPVVEAVWPAANWSYRSMRQATVPFEVDSVCGAAMLVRNKVIDQVGLLDPAFDPIYSEEVEWCYRIRQAGWLIYAHPQARIIHYGSQTMNRVVPRKYELLLSHKALFFAKHHGTQAANVYKTVLRSMTVGKLIWWALAGLAPGGRQVGREKRLLHWRLLKCIPSM